MAYFIFSTKESLHEPWRFFLFVLTHLSNHICGTIVPHIWADRFI